MKWKNIKIPEELYNTISSLAQKKNISKYKLIANAVTFYISFHEKSRERGKILKENDELIEKLVWKLYKLIKSVGHFIENTKLYNLQMLNERIEELTEFISKLEFEEKAIVLQLLNNLKELVKKYFNNKSKETLKEINQTSKILLKLIVLAF